MDKDKKRGFLGLSDLASDILTIPTEESQADPSPEAPQISILPLIDMTKWPSIPAPWSSTDAGETWIWGDFFITFQKRPLSALEVALKGKGEASDFSRMMTYHYAMSIFYRLDKNRCGPSLRPIMVIGLEQLDKTFLEQTAAKQAGKTLSGDGRSKKNPVTLGVFTSDAHRNYGEYGGDLTPQAVKQAFFDTLGRLLPVSGAPKKIGTLAQAHGHPETGLPDQTKAGSEPIQWWPFKLAVTITGVLLIMAMISIGTQQGMKSSSTTPSSTQTYSPRETASAPARQATSLSQGSAPQYKKPQTGTNNVLSEPEICWCIRENIRIEAMRGVMDTNEGITEFNRIVDDYNSRCGSYRYRQGSQSRAERDVEPYRSQIVAEAITEARRFSSKPKANARPSLLEAITKSGKAGRPLSGGSASSVSKKPGRQETLEAQELLTELGYNPGPLDGDYGRWTSEAVKAFQQDVGIARDGWIDEDLLNALRKAKASQRPKTPSTPTTQPQASLESPSTTPSVDKTAAPKHVSYEDQSKISVANRLSALGYTVDWSTSSLADMLDAESRINTANRLATLGYNVDWQASSLGDMLAAESRISAANRLSRLGYTVDWRTSSLSDMIDAESRISTANRLSRLGYTVDWRTSSLAEMLDAESRICTANRLKNRGLHYDWRGYSLSQLLSIEATEK